MRDFAEVVVITGFMILLLSVVRTEVNRVVHPPQIPITITEACQKTADAYFRMGVSCTAMVIIQRKLAGESIPNPEQLLIEAKAYVDSMGGKEEYLK